MLPVETLARPSQVREEFCLSCRRVNRAVNSDYSVMELIHFSNDGLL